METVELSLTPVGVAYEADNGAFILLPKRGEHSTEEVNQSKRWLRIEHNVQSISIQWS